LFLNAHQNPASLSPEMREQLRHDISAIEHGIQVAEESQVKLKKWEVENIKQGHITFISIWTIVVLFGYFAASRDSS
jgi:hypothetical protein